ncbi:indole-3-glycerol phosphate synthase TrpC [Sphingobacterium sp. N143]|uniref:indole-3-glycerol phosphate synthase TrpC n=1 Tax=Sphingobacterium sp. N143 TaxID=2746727 RepID=UPI00257619DA|nr:indole-3-glycerol phosphate synthase TrpC [Sphingobacterium sp. N143]MDM1295497.1 indole-3-glycerol phosphate synthase TrpC [Sphingobacterium sp. N143]
MTILDKIIERKKIEVEKAKALVPFEELLNYPYFGVACLSLRESILDPEKTGIIAEYKRASPSKGNINSTSAVEDVVKAYEEAGASAVSVLTDGEFFKGNLEDLSKARKVLNIPILRKEFIVDKYQITEAKAYGADVILLIAACLKKEEVQEFAAYAHQIGLNVLLEVHNEQELLDNLFDDIDAIGVNNRNLKDFTVDLQHSYDLLDKIPSEYIKVSESGISDPSTIKALRKAGFQGFLIGENFMKTNNPGQAIKDFVKQL